MQARTARRRTAASRREDQAIAADGVVARVVERAIDNPAMTGGLFVMALTAAAIVSNAMFLQNGRHPDPLFMTRPAAEDPAPVPIPRSRVDRVEATPPIPRVAPEPAATTPAAARIAPDTRLVASLQRALAGKGLYGGAIDGITGSRTRAAVAAYEEAQGLPITGEPSAGILDRIATASLKPLPKPAAPVKAEKVAVPPAPAKAEKAAPIPPMPVAAVAPAASAPAAAPPMPAPAVVAASEPDPAAVLRERYLQVQGALNRMGYGPLPVDGEPADDTANAIRRFELDNGLPITGKAGDRVLARLTAIGAMQAD